MVASKNLKRIVDAEINDLPILRAILDQKYQNAVKTNSGRRLNPWLFVFTRGLGQQNSNASDRRNKELAAFFNALKEEELPFSVQTKDERINHLLKSGKILPPDLAPLYNMSKAKQKALGIEPVTRKGFDFSDPFCWGAFITILAQAFRSPGRRKRPLMHTLQLAFDILEIHGSSHKWDTSRVVNALRKKEPYKARYTSASSSSGSSGIGTRRVREVARLVGLIRSSKQTMSSPEESALTTLVRKRGWEKISDVDQLMRLIKSSESSVAVDVKRRRRHA